MTHVEEAVYDALWGTKKKGEPEPYRLAQMGYAELSAKSRVSKRTIQSVIDRMVEKHFIEVETPADILRRTPTVYRVYSYVGIRRYQRDTGRNWVVRTGKGVFYARKLSSTVGAMASSTVETRAPSTMETTSPSTAEATSTYKEGTIRQGITSSAMREIQQAIAPLGLGLDDDGVSQIITASREVNPKAGPEEIAHFIGVAVQHNHRGGVRTWVGFLKAAVPKYLVEGSTTLVAYREGKAREKAELRRQAQAVLEDPQATQQEREWAAGVLADSS
jgi:hypothetical protein